MSPCRHPVQSVRLCRPRTRNGSSARRFRFREMQPVADHRRVV